MQVFRMVVLIGLIAIQGVVLTTGPAGAQNLMPGFKLNDKPEPTTEEIERNKANEEAAKAARAKIPDAKASSDPWAAARAAETPAKTQKTVKPKAAAQ